MLKGLFQGFNFSRRTSLVSLSKGGICGEILPRCWKVMMIKPKFKMAEEHILINFVETSVAVQMKFANSVESITAAKPGVRMSYKINF